MASDDLVAVEAVAKQANSEQNWDHLWGKEGDSTWRQHALSSVYTRVAYLVPPDSKVVDIGGGVGLLGAAIKQKNCTVTVCDISKTALDLAAEKGLAIHQTDLEKDGPPPIEADVVIGTEILEHLSAETRDKILSWAAKSTYGALLSVPNNRLGPDQESQHTIKFTAIAYKRELEKYHQHVRVECIDGYLLGVIGKLAEKTYKLSVCFPARDESKDIEKTLASFRGVADQMVIGIDPRSVDNSYEIAERYADEVFYLDSPQGPPDDYQGDKGVHFSWIRNQCIDRCVHEWIFMTEAHEYLHSGQDILLKLKDVMPERVRVGMVARQGSNQRWAFPWLFKNSKDIRFDRSVHNILVFPNKTFVVKLPQIVTMHSRHDEVSARRNLQRKSQNRKSLFDDWLERGSTHSLFYLAQEWRGYDTRKAAEYFEKFLVTSNNGPQKYQARLILAKQFMQDNNMKEAKRVLLQAVGDDWMRTEHWIWLGDIVFSEEKYEEAYIYYAYSTILIGTPPFTQWWSDLSNYTYLPPQRMAMVCGQLGRLAEGLAWSLKVIEFLPQDAPQDLVDEAKSNIGLFEEAIRQASPNQK